MFSSSRPIHAILSLLLNAKSFIEMVAVYHSPFLFTLGNLCELNVYSEPTLDMHRDILGSVPPLIILYVIFISHPSVISNSVLKSRMSDFNVAPWSLRLEPPYQASSNEKLMLIASVGTFAPLPQLSVIHQRHVGKKSCIPILYHLLGKEVFPSLLKN